MRRAAIRCACACPGHLRHPRPLDGDANGIPRCDIGAVEAGALTSSTYVVNVYDADLVDANPGDDICDANRWCPAASAPCARR
jgi:hypothetical protein